MFDFMADFLLGPLKLFGYDQISVQLLQLNLISLATM